MTAFLAVLIHAVPVRALTFSATDKTIDDDRWNVRITNISMPAPIDVDFGLGGANGVKLEGKVIWREALGRQMLATVAFRRHGSKSPLTDEWVRKTWHVYIMDYYSAIKDDAIFSDTDGPRDYHSDIS